MDPVTVALGTAAAVGIGAGLHMHCRVHKAESTATGLRRELAAERRAADHDPLTDLPNRRSFYRHGEAMLGADARPPIACLVLDLNYFKEVNDTLGHAVGDGVLMTIAGRLVAYAGGNLVARLGGDEFAGLITGPRGTWRWLHPTAERLAQVLAAPMRVAGHSVCITAAVGAAPAPCFARLSEVLHRADRAMYRAKSTGVRTACFNQVLDDDTAYRPGRRPAIRTRDLDTSPVPATSTLRGRGPRAEQVEARPFIEAMSSSRARPHGPVGARPVRW